MTDETRYDREEEDAFAEFLSRHGDEAYNPPPETPVEAIWEGVREARDRGPDGAIPIAPRRWLLPVLAVAAVLLLGIMLGRISMREATERQGPAGPAVATRSEPATERPVPEDTAPNGSPDGSPPAATAPSGPPAASPPSAEDQARPARMAGPRTPTAPREPPTRPAGPEDPTRPDRAGELYRLASVQMLAQAEALLVDYRSGAAGRQDAGEIGRWARDVLASTRLLLGSRATRDPAMRSLLQDLELVLAQIVHHTGADPIEGEMIDRSIEEHDLIPRLRTAIPSGDSASL